MFGRGRFGPHRHGVDDLAGLALPDVVGLVHHHVVLPPAVQVRQGVLLGVETNLQYKICTYRVNFRYTNVYCINIQGLSTRRN